MRALLIEPRRRVSRVVHKKRKRILVLSALLFSMALLFFTLLVFLSRREDFLIRDIAINGNALVPKSELVLKIDSLVEGSYLDLFPRRNYFLFPKSVIAQGLLTAFPAIEKVSVSRSSFKTVSVDVTERVPFALYCVSTLDPECFFIDKDGLVFAPSPSISSDVYLRFVGSASTSPVGTTVFSPERFHEFTYFIQSLRDLGLSPHAIVIEKGTAGIPDFSIVLDSETKLLISGAQGLQQVLANIAAFFNDPEIADSRESFLRKALYIDFRFENKVFYKMRP